MKGQLSTSVIDARMGTEYPRSAIDSRTWIHVSSSFGLVVPVTVKEIALSYDKLDPQHAREIKPLLAILLVCQLKPDPAFSEPTLVIGSGLCVEIRGFWIYNSKTGEVYRKFTLDDIRRPSSDDSNGIVTTPPRVESRVTPRVTAAVTSANFNRIEEGMTYAQVVGILGREGTEISRSSMAGYTTVMYQWQGEGLGNMNAMFQNGRLISKAQFGLK